MRMLWLLFTITPLIALGIAEGTKLPTKLIYNGSESAPLGFYWIEKTPVVRGDYVLVIVPKRVKKLIERRGYLPENIPLLKRIVATNGDTICRQRSEILLDGVTIAVARFEDDADRKLPDWQGCRVLKTNELFLLQDHPNSFDGRYFGPVDRSTVFGKATKMRLSW